MEKQIMTPQSTVFNMDCMEGMKDFPDKFFELAICDPPYGIGYCRTGTTYTKGRGGKNFTSATHYEKKDWDEAPPPPEYFAELIRVSKNQIIWGGNHFQLEPSRGWVYWDKKIANATTENYSDGELAWTSFDRVLKKFTYDWVGFGYLNSKEKGTRIHPTQKPIALYQWLLKNYAKPGDKILDTHMGSQSSRIACYKMGFSFTGYEIDRDYFESGCKRFEQSIAEPLFDQPKTEQGKLL